jgi:hypothetical protein
MAYSAPSTRSAGDIITDTIWNQDVVDNVKATAVGIVTTAGDTIYATGANALARLGIGTAYQGLGVNSGATAPEWQATATSTLTAQGDVLYASGANTLARLAKGTARQALHMNAGATAPEWVASPASTLTTQGDVLYASAANTIARLAIGTAYQGIGVNSGATAPEWQATSTSVLTTQGDTLYASAANTIARLAIGTAKQVLQTNAGATAPEWTSAVDVTTVTTSGAANIGGDLNHDGSNIGFFGVAPAARAAAYTPSNVSADRSFDADTVAIAELADVVGTLIADLQSYGLLQ